VHEQHSELGRIFALRKPSHAPKHLKIRNFIGAADHQLQRPRVSAAPGCFIHPAWSAPSGASRATIAPVTVAGKISPKVQTATDNRYPPVVDAIAVSANPTPTGATPAARVTPYQARRQYGLSTANDDPVEGHPHCVDAWSKSGAVHG
jgi:hypothetical protein